MNQDIQIRWAITEADRAAAFQLRYELYVEDQGLFRDVADHERRWLTDDYDLVSHIAVAEVDGRIVGTIRNTYGSDVEFSESTRQEYDMDRFRGVVDDRDIGIVTRLLVRKEFRGNGVLSFRLLWTAFEHCAIHDQELLLGSCEPHLVNRYRTLGFQPYGKLYNHPTSGALVPIAIVLGDLAHMRRIKSPMASALARRTRPHDEVDHILPLIVHDRSIKSRGHDPEGHWNELFRWLDEQSKEADGEPLGILSTLSYEDSSVLLAKSHIIDCRPGDAIILKGHVSRTLYILLRGSLEIRDEGRPVAAMEKGGDLVGEVAFFTEGRRMSDVLAGPGGASVLALSAGNLHQTIQGYGPTAAKFLHYVARGLCQKLEERARSDGF